MEQIHVLLVDDHAMVRAALRCILEGYPDMAVTEADNGMAAIEAVERSQPDVIVMDISMPVMNGIEATRRIKALHPLIPVIGLSVNAHPEPRAAMTEAGAATLMLKEKALELLYSVIKEAVVSQCAASR